MKYKELAKQIIASYPYLIIKRDESNNLEKYLCQESDEVLLDQIKAMKNIFTEAEKEMEKTNE